MTPDVARNVLRKIDTASAAQITKVPEEVLEFFIVFGTIPVDYWRSIHFNLDILAEMLPKHGRRKKQKANTNTSLRPLCKRGRPESSSPTGI